MTTILNHCITPVIPLTVSTLPDIMTPSTYYSFFSRLKEGLQYGTYKGDFVLDVKGPYADWFEDDIIRTYSDHGSIFLDVERTCRAGLHELTVCPDGEVIPCFFMYRQNYKYHSLGNILIKHIDDIIEKGMLYRRINIERSKHCAEKNGCTTCCQRCPLWVVPCILPSQG
jgi:radical SAM protein with 4Fe4S-binding SPASM domain